MKRAALAWLLSLWLTAVVHAATYYVDPVTGSDSNSGTIGSPFLTPHKAQLAVSAGDTVYFRGGTYQHGCTNGSALALDGIRQLFVQTSGTSGNPITYKAYPGETPVFMGRGYTNEDTNADNNEDGALASCGPAGNERLVEFNNGVTYVVLDGLTLEFTNRYAVYIGQADHITVQNCHIFATWDIAVWVEGNNNTIQNNWIHNSQHGSGVTLRPSVDTQTVNDTLIRGNFVYSNGYRYPNPNNTNTADIRRVQPAAGDSAGGGNSDSFTCSKDCATFALDVGAADSESLCKRAWFDGNVAFHNTDDGFDISCDNMEVSTNVSITNGGGPDAWGLDASVNGVGYKIFSTSPRPRGNVWVGNFSGFNQQSGWELRDMAGWFLHNSGFWNAGGTASNNTVASLAIDNFVIANNEMVNNQNTGSHVEWGVTQLTTGCTTCRNNLLTDTSGSAVGGTNLTSTSPGFVNTAEFKDPVSGRYLNIPVVGATAATLIANVVRPLYDAFCPGGGSAAIDAGWATTWTNPQTGLSEYWQTKGLAQEIGWCEVFGTQPPLRGGQ
jgi:Right handed beta helix region